MNFYFNNVFFSLFYSIGKPSVTHAIEVKTRTEKHLNKIGIMVTHKRFDYLIMHPHFLPNNLCNKYYRPIGVIRVKIFHYNQDFDLIVWAPQ